MPKPYPLPMATMPAGPSGFPMPAGFDANAFNLDYDKAPSVAPSVAPSLPPGFATMPAGPGGFALPEGFDANAFGLDYTKAPAAPDFSALGGGMPKPAAAAPTLPAGFAPASPSVAPTPPAWWTNKAGDTSISPSGRVTYFSGAAADRYDAGTGYAPTAPVMPAGPMGAGVPFTPDAGQSAPVGRTAPVMTPGMFAPRRPAPSSVGLRGIADTPGNALAGYGSPSVAPKMSTGDWASIIRGKDPVRLAQLGLRYGGSGDYFTPQGQASRAQEALAAMRELGESRRQEAQFQNTLFLKGVDRAESRDAAAIRHAQELFLKTGQSDPGAAGDVIRTGVELENKGKLTAAEAAALKLAQERDDAARVARGEPTRSEAQNLKTQLTVQERARMLPGETEADAALRLRGEANTKGAQGKATLKKTEVDTARDARPRDEDVLDQLLEKAHGGDFEAAKKYNRMQQRIVESRGGMYLPTNAMPESAEAYAKKYPGRAVAPAKPSTPNERAKAPPVGTIGMYKGVRSRWNGTNFEPVK